MNQCNSDALRETLRGVAHDVDNGLALSDALGRRVSTFSELAVVMLRAGEAGGTLDDVLERLAVMLERQDDFRRRLAASLAYPVFVAIAALCLVAFLVISILPTFGSLYAQLRVPLPRSTAMLLGIAALGQPANAVPAAIVIGACAFVIAVLTRKFGPQLAASGVFYRVPVLGTIARKSSLARLARMLGTLLRSGIPLVAALDVAAAGLGRGAFGKSLASVMRQVSEGIGLSKPMAGDPLYDPLFLQLITVGEEAGTLDTMLLKAADFYESDVEVSLNAATALIEPAMILGLGAVVAGIVASILLPLYSMIGSIR